MWHNRRACTDTGFKTYRLISLHKRGILWYATTMLVFCSNSQRMAMCLTCSGRIERLPSLHRWCLSVLTDVHLSVCPLGIYEEDSQWMTQVNRLQKLIDRLEKKVTFVPLLLVTPPLLLGSFHSLCFPSPSQPSAPHISLKLSTNPHKWTHTITEKLPWQSNNRPHTNIYAYVQCAGNIRHKHVLQLLSVLTAAWSLLGIDSW